ncbi:MAG: amidohydrolase [Chloroflexi bacterium]|nr:amidohydrolase [Chloroflexota bacterium]
MSSQFSADLILSNARVLTLDPLKPRASVVTIKDDRVVGVSENTAPWVSRGTKLMDCGGKTIVPGFNDAHCHVLAFVQSLLSLDFSPPNVTSIAQMKAAISQRVQQAPPGAWITATGYNEFYVAERRLPTRDDLDEAAPLNPVRVLHRSGHVQMLNSLALSRVGITAETPEPPGALIDRDPETGEPNGVLFEMNAFVADRVPPMEPEELKRGLLLANRAYLSQGITSLQDASARNGLAQWELFLDLKATGQLIPRLSVMPGYQALDEFLDRGITPGAGDNEIRLGAVKFVPEETTGALYPPQQTLNELVLRAHNAGYQVALHAIDTVEAAAIALEYALSRQPRQHRHRVEHCSVCPPHILDRLARLEVIVVTQPPFLYYSGERYMAEAPKGDLPWLYRIRSFREAGLRPAGSSDSPVVLNSPLIGIYAAATRLADTGQAILPEEAISVEEALEMYTAAAAYASCEETEKGTITPGKLADLVLLDRDPTAVALEEIKSIKVEMTMLGGKVVWGGV